MTEREKKFALEAMLAEMEFWKFRKTSVFNPAKPVKGCYVPDFILLLEAARIFGRPVQEDEKTELMKVINKHRVSRRARFEDFCPKD